MTPLGLPVVPLVYLQSAKSTVSSQQYASKKRNTIQSQLKFYFLLAIFTPFLI